MEKMAWDGITWGREGLFPANPDLADILGDIDLHFDNFYFLFVWIPSLWISRFIDFQNLPPGRAWTGPGRT